ncbi:MAG: hypothetical protein M1823_000094 [Watsoniomyces obsoletus]|nr:MAG: hypothetical protein M1823_000094 [Watsoniomyces obsoletus]
MVRWPSTMRESIPDSFAMTNINELKEYRPPPVFHPDMNLSQASTTTTFFRSWFRPRTSSKRLRIPDNLPKGLYMYGDVGCGKTMLMDLFYETLPRNISAKTRIHFHNFMQDVHRRMHMKKMEHGLDFDALPSVTADLAETSTVLLEGLMSQGVVLVTTSNRHPNELYMNGIQRESFIPCITLLKSRLHIINLDSQTDYRKIPRPPSGVFHFPLDKAASSHADKWFRFLGDFESDPPHPARHRVWGREIVVPAASNGAAWFTFDELIGRPTSAADYLELMKWYDGFIVTDVPGMTHRQRDLARRFITFVDAVYESRAKLVLTSAVPLTQLFMSAPEMRQAVEGGKRSGNFKGGEGTDVDDVMRSLMDDLGMNMQMLKQSNLFSGEEERFAFARALSRLSEMGSQEWIERGMGLEKAGGRAEKEGWQRVRSRWREDSL